MENLQEIYLTYFAAFSIVAGKTLPFVIEAINRWLNLEGKTVKSITSWIVPILLMYAGWGLSHIFEAGFLAGVEYWHPLAYGAWAALLSNIEWNNVPWLKDAVNAFFDWLIKKK